MRDEDLREILLRLERAGWVLKFSLDPEKRVDFSAVGVERLDELCKLPRAILDSGAEPTGPSTGRMGELLSELLPPNFSEREFQSFLTFLELYRTRTR